MDVPWLAIDAGADALHANVDNIDAHLVEDGRRHGLKVRVWNTRDPKQIRWLLSVGVDAIGSDRPDVLLYVIRN